MALHNIYGVVCGVWCATVLNPYILTQNYTTNWFAPILLHFFILSSSSFFLNLFFFSQPGLIGLKTSISLRVWGSTACGKSSVNNYLSRSRTVGCIVLLCALNFSYPRVPSLPLSLPPSLIFPLPPRLPALSLSGYLSLHQV